MKMVIVKADGQGLAKAAAAIRAGGTVIFPTETCYGIAADATNPRAVEKVFMAKGRRKEKALSIIVANESMAEKYCKLTPLARRLAKKFMPGPLTLVVKKKSGLAKNLTTGSTVAFRVPGYSFALKLAKKAGRPITATSANQSGAPPLYDIGDVKMLFSNKADLIVDAGNLKKNPPSTLVDATSRPPRILREGALAAKVRKELGSK